MAHLYPALLGKLRSVEARTSPTTSPFSTLNLLMICWGVLGQVVTSVGAGCPLETQEAFGLVPCGVAGWEGGLRHRVGLSWAQPLYHGQFTLPLEKGVTGSDATDS